jgi:hypothetical protein
VLLNWHYGGSTSVTLVDGDGPPQVTRHSSPFSNGELARQFQRANGVREVQVNAPEDLPLGQFDLILSFRAWCFHFAPACYLEFVRRAAHDKTVLILEMRRGKDEWLEQVRSAFPQARHLADGRKTSTWAFQR